MKVIFVSEDTPDGEEADWPAIPPVGSIVSFNHRGGRSHLQVDNLRWQLDTNGEFQHVEVNLVYPH